MKTVWQYFLAIRADTATLHILGIERDDWWWSTPVVELDAETARTRSGSVYRLGQRTDDIAAADPFFVWKVVARDGEFLVVPIDVGIEDLKDFIDAGRAHAVAVEKMMASQKVWPLSMRIAA
ncbi:MAG: hypothetical protein O9320_16005 [Magnetospirillum sp.]|nr:hypothetical protein [Magnetospirillum sp.]